MTYLLWKTNLWLRPYNNIEIGEMITEDLYEAVAEVLAYVYSLKDEFRGT